MTPRIICPHCHCAIDPLTLEAAVSAQAQYRICPECDSPIVVGCADASDAAVASSPPASVLPAIDNPPSLPCQGGAYSPLLTRGGREGLGGRRTAIGSDAGRHDL